MTIRNLDRVLAPRRVAVIGASSRPRAVGHLVLANMRAAGFSGTLMPVNPRETEIDGLPTYASPAMERMVGWSPEEMIEQGGGPGRHRQVGVGGVGRHPA